MDLAMIIDAVILVFLGITIFYAWRLSTYMKIFRDSRKDMEALFISLNQDIDRAEKSVLGMRNAAESAGMRLNEIIKDSKFLADELKFMNEAGDSLATRLEKLADKNRALVDQLEQAGGITPNTPYRPTTEQRATAQEWGDDEEDMRSRRLFNANDMKAAPASAANQSAPQGGDTPSFRSEAERDLYEALQRKRVNP